AHDYKSLTNLSQILEHSPVRLEPLAEHHIELLRAACAEDQYNWVIYAVNMLGDDVDQAMRGFHGLKSWVQFAAIHVATGKVIGMSNYINPDQYGVVEIGGTYISPSLRGSGFNRAMKKVM